jgi:hypothetical protein
MYRINTASAADLAVADPVAVVLAVGPVAAAPAVAVLAVVPVAAVPGAAVRGAAVRGDLYFVSYTGCQLSSALMSSLLLG